MRALEQKGWSVWWDRDIPPGKTFDEVIEEAINAAKCVIVVWSKDSVRSDWVKTEAAEGARRGILIPVLIDDVKLPLEFRRIQAASLVDWTGTLSHPGFEQLSEAIAGILSHSPSGVTPGIEEQGTGGKKGEETERLDQERRECETHEKVDRAGQEEPTAFYQQKAEITPNNKNWTKIIAGAGIVVLIIAAVIVYREFTKEIKITVQSPKIDYFKAIPETVEKGEKSNLSWSTSNAKEVFFSKESVALSGSQDVTPEKTTTYTLVAKNEKGEDEKKVTVKVNIPPLSPEIRDFKAVPGTIEKGNSSNLIWEISNAKEVTIDNEIGEVGLSGQQKVSPEKTTTYTLVAKNEKGEEIEKKVTVEVKVSVLPPEILNFVAKPSKIKRGDVSTLSWRTSGAKEVFLGKQRVETSGSQDFTPEKTTTYTLVAKNEEGGRVEKKVAVQVSVPILPPKIDLKAIPETTKKGVEEQETKNLMVQYPKRYIKIIDRSIYVAWNGATIIHHVIIENTSDISYKNIKVRVSYYSESGTEISGQTGILPVTVPPHSKKTYLEGGIVLGMGSSGMHAGNIEVLGAVPVVGE